MRPETLICQQLASCDERKDNIELLIREAPIVRRVAFNGRERESESELRAPVFQFGVPCWRLVY